VYNVFPNKQLGTFNDGDFEACFDLLNVITTDEIDEQSRSIASKCFAHILDLNLNSVRIIRVVTRLIRFVVHNDDKKHAASVLNLLRQTLITYDDDENVFIATCQCISRFPVIWKTKSFWKLLMNNLTEIWLRSTSCVSKLMYMSLLRSCLEEKEEECVSQIQRDVARQVISSGGLSKLLSFEKNKNEARDLCSVLCSISGLNKMTDFTNVPKSLNFALDKITRFSSSSTSIVSTQDTETTLMMVWLSQVSKRLGYRDDANDLTTRDVLSSLIESRVFFNMMSSRCVKYVFFICASLHEFGTTIAPMSSEVLFRRAQIELHDDNTTWSLGDAVRKSQRQSVVLFAYHLIVSLSNFQGTRDRYKRRFMLRSVIDLFTTEELRRPDDSSVITLFTRLASTSTEFSESKRKNFVRDVLSLCITSSLKDLNACIFLLRFVTHVKCFFLLESTKYFVLREVVSVMRIDRIRMILMNRSSRDMETERVSVLLSVICEVIRKCDGKLTSEIVSVLRRLVPAVASACVMIHHDYSTIKDLRIKIRQQDDDFMFASIEILRISLRHADFFKSTWPRVPEKLLKVLCDVAFRYSDRTTHACVCVFTQICEIVVLHSDFLTYQTKVRDDIRDFFKCKRFVNGLSSRASHNVAISCLNFVCSFLSNTWMSDKISTFEDTFLRLLLLNIQRNILVSDPSRRESAKFALESLRKANPTQSARLQRQPWSLFVSRYMKAES